jgi:hypothetical protein
MNEGREEERNSSLFFLFCVYLFDLRPICGSLLCWMRCHINLLNLIYGDLSILPAPGGEGGIKLKDPASNCSQEV